MEYTVFIKIVGFAIQLDKAKLQFAILTEEVFLAVDRLEAGQHHAVLAKVILRIVEGEPAGQHDAVLAEIITLSVNIGKAGSNRHPIPEVVGFAERCDPSVGGNRFGGGSKRPGQIAGLTENIPFNRLEFDGQRFLALCQTGGKNKVVVSKCIIAPAIERTVPGSCKGSVYIDFGSLIHLLHRKGTPQQNAVVLGRNCEGDPASALEQPLGYREGRGAFIVCLEPILTSRFRRSTIHKLDL